MELIENILSIVLGSAFFLYISLSLNKYIFLSIFCIIPLNKKYKNFFQDPLFYKCTGRIMLVILSVVALFLMFYIAYMLSKVAFGIFLFIFFIQMIFLIIQIKKFSLLDLINYYTADVFNWYAICDADINADIKKACFNIHNIDYSYYINSLDKYKKFALDNIVIKSMQKIVVCKGTPLKNNLDINS